MTVRERLVELLEDSRELHQLARGNGEHDTGEEAMIGRINLFLALLEDGMITIQERLQ